MIISKKQLKILIETFLIESDYKGIFDGGWSDNNWNSFLDTLDDSSLPDGAKKKDLKASWPKAAKKLGVTSDPSGVKKFIDQVESGKYKYIKAKTDDELKKAYEDKGSSNVPPDWTSGKYTQKGSTGSNLKLKSASLISSAAFSLFQLAMGSSRNLITRMYGAFVKRRTETFTEAELDPDIKLGLGFIIAWTISKNKKAFEAGQRVAFGDDSDYQAVAALPDYIDVFGPSLVGKGAAESNISDNMIASKKEKVKESLYRKLIKEDSENGEADSDNSVDDTVKRSFVVKNSEDPLSNIKNTITHMFIQKSGEDSVIIEDRYDFNPARNMITSKETGSGKVKVFKDIEGKQVEAYQEDTEYFSNPDYLFHFLEDARNGKTKIWHAKKGWIKGKLFSRAGIENLSRFYQGCYGYGGFPIVIKLKISELLKYDGGDYLSNTWQRATSGLKIFQPLDGHASYRDISAQRTERRDQIAGRELSVDDTSSKQQQFKDAVAKWESQDKRGKKISSIYINRMIKSSNPIAAWTRFKRNNLDDFPRRNMVGMIKYKYPEDKVPDIFEK